jgi:hypothetical protein
VDDFLEPFELSEPMPCYEFHGGLSEGLDDGRCAHCRKFLTLDCPYIGHFLGDEHE